MVELHKRQPRTLQKTIRIPRVILAWLDLKAKEVEISVPQAIVQIIEKAYIQERKEVGQ